MTLGTATLLLLLALGGIAACRVCLRKKRSLRRACMAALSVLAMLIMLILSIAGVLKGSAGWIIASIFLCGGTNLAAIGVIGEYVGKAYLETKHRPKYFIEEELIA